MAVIDLESVVLRGVSVGGDGKAVELRLGSYLANQTPMVPFSMRHPSPGCREDQTEPPQRPLCPAWHGTDNAAALRAGRPDDSPAGVLGRRSPARNAGRAVQLGWPIAVGEAPCPGCSERSPFRAVADGQAVLPGRPLTTFAVVPSSGRLWAQGKRQKAAGLEPARGTPAISTRGTGDRAG